MNKKQQVQEMLARCGYVSNTNHKTYLDSMTSSHKPRGGFYKVFMNDGFVLTHRDCNMVPALRKILGKPSPKLYDINYYRWEC